MFPVQPAERLLAPTKPSHSFAAGTKSINFCFVAILLGTRVEIWHTHMHANKWHVIWMANGSGFIIHLRVI